MPIGFVDVLWRNLTGHYFWIKFVAPRELKRATSLGEKRNTIDSLHAADDASDGVFAKVRAIDG